MREWAGIEDGHGADLVAGEGEGEQPGRATGPGLGVFDVAAERGLPVGPGGDEAGRAAGAEHGGGEEAGDLVAAVVFARLRGMVTEMSSVSRATTAATSPSS